MFRAGQTVYHKTSKHSGIVQESDPTVTYVMQANGVEIDFPTRELTLVPPLAKTDSEPLSRNLTMRDITPEHQKVLAAIPARTLQAVAVLWERKPINGKFSALNVAQKLNFIAEVTEVPYRVMRVNIGQPGELGLMMGRGLAERNGLARPR